MKQLLKTCMPLVRCLLTHLPSLGGVGGGLLLILLCSFCWGNLYAQKQGQALIDSLLLELPKQKEDTNKVDMLASMSFIYYNISPDEGIKYGQKAVELATTLDWKKGLANAYNCIGVNYYRESDYLMALEYYQKALKVDEELGYKHSAVSINTNIALIYQSQSDFPTALAYSLKNLKLAEDISDEHMIAIICGNIGNIYRAQGDYNKALEYDFKALGIKEKLGDKTSIAISVGNIGIVYRYQKNYRMAIEYGEKALKMAQETGNKYIIAADLCSIGSVYVSIVKDSVSKPLPGKAAYLQKAIGYLQQSLAASKAIHAPDVMQESYEDLSVACKLGGDYKKALEYADIFWAIKDSVFSKQNNDKIAKISMSDEYQRKRLTDSMATIKIERAAALKLQRQRGYTWSGFAAVLLLVGFSFFITKERRKSERLLLNILPAEVAAELKEKGVSEAKQFDKVTVILSDFVSFSKASERLGPDALVSELDECFRAFDGIMGKYHIEKIKTIGDAYLAICGLPRPDVNHAENTARAAIEMNAFMQDRRAKLGDKTFEIRIGIHSGSVVAGIVGVKKFAYDIWGDTVNIAARMEQNSMPGKINISQTTYELIKDKFTCEYRGEIEAKNKGRLKMYVVS